MRIAGAAATLAAALCLGGCASSLSADWSPSMQAAQSSAAAALNSAVAIPDLHRIVLTAADLPSDWTAHPAEAVPTMSGKTTASNPLAQCVGATPSGAGVADQAISESFGKPPSGLSSLAIRYKNANDAALQAAVMRKPEFASCLSRYYTASLAALPAGARATPSLTVTPSPAGLPSDVAAVVETRLDVSQDGQRVPIFFDMAVVVSGPVQAAVVGFSVINPVPSGVWRGAVTAVATRAAAA